MINIENFLNEHEFILPLLFIMFSPLILVLVILLFIVLIVLLLIQAFFYIVPIIIVTNYIGIILTEIISIILTSNNLALYEKIVMFSPYFVIVNMFILGLFSNLLEIFKPFSTSTKKTKTIIYTFLFWISFGITSWICW